MFKPSITRIFDEDEGSLSLWSHRSRPDNGSGQWESHIRTFMCAYASVHTGCTHPHTIYGMFRCMAWAVAELNRYAGFHTHKLNGACCLHTHIHTHIHALCQPDVRKTRKVGSQQRAPYPLELIHFSTLPPALLLTADLCLHFYLMSSGSICFLIRPHRLFLPSFSPCLVFWLKCNRFICFS